MNIISGSLTLVLMHLLHPFYISMTDINYNAGSKALEVSVRIFTDDFENTLRKQHGNINIDILHPASQQQMNGFVNDYIHQKLSIQLNGKPVTYTFVGYEQQEESIWTYFEVKDVSTVNTLFVSDGLLYDYNKDEVNMVHVKVGEKESTEKVNYPDVKLSFAFK